MAGVAPVADVNPIQNLSAGFVTVKDRNNKDQAAHLLNA